LINHIQGVLRLEITNRIPVVAIVGRPNVGKSTLFNRLIGEQDAIVDATPGVTRDRHYGLTEWSGRSFALIDTGGFIPESTDLIDTAVREQASIAIEEADLVILLVDGTASLSSTELQIASLLRRQDKRFLFVANKVDNEKMAQILAADPSVYKLGLGQPIVISALNSRNIGDLLDKILEFIPPAGAHEVDESIIRLAVVGRPNVGKSSLVNAIIGSPKHIVSDVPGTTRDSIDSDFVYEGQSFKLIDTAGLRRKAKVKENLEFYSSLRTLKTIQECDVAILLLDPLEGLASQDINVLEEARRFKKGLLLVVNKWDLVEKDDKTYLQFERTIRDSLGSTRYIPILFISALTRQRVLKVLETARAIHQERCRSVSTSELNQFLRNAVAANHPPAVRGKDIRLNYMTQIKTRPPVFALFTNEPALIPANYRQYLENQLRETFGFAGVPISLTFRKKNKERVE
jgi:GTP-binding protein